MKINELKNIAPLKYNEYFSVHKQKTTPKNNIKKLSMMKTFSRNFNSNLKQIQYSLTNEHNSNKKFIDNNNYTNNEYEQKPNKGAMSPNNFFRLTNYIRNKYAKNMTKIKNNAFSPNKIKELNINVNRTEYNKSNNKCFRIEAMQNLKPKTQAKLFDIKNGLSSKEIYFIQKREFLKAINSEKIRKNLIDNYSSIIYYQIFPKRMQNNLYLYQNIPNILNIQTITNLKKSHNLAKKPNKNSLMISNIFSDIIIENVARKVEYKNQLNESITINYVKNLLDEEIDLINKKINNNESEISKINNDCKLNKSTSTEDIPNLKFLNETYDKFSHTTANSEKKIEQIFMKKLENKLYELNNKYGFKDSLNINYGIIFDTSFNIDNHLNSDSEKFTQIKSNKRRKIEGDGYDADNLREFILSMGNEINNLSKYKYRNEQGKEYIFQNTTIRNIFGKVFKKNKIEKNNIDDFDNNINYEEANKSIEFNDFEKNILYSYYQYKKMKYLIQNNKSGSKNKNKKEFIKAIDKNNSNLKKEKEVKPEIKFKISSNFDIKDIMPMLNDQQEFENFMNGFAGYYANNEEKEILKRIKNIKPNETNFLNLYNEIKTNIINEKKEEKKVKRKLYNDINKSILSKAFEKNYNKVNQTDIKESNLIIKNNIGDKEEKNSSKYKKNVKQKKIPADKIKDNEIDAFDNKKIEKGNLNKEENKKINKEKSTEKEIKGEREKDKENINSSNKISDKKRQKYSLQKNSFENPNKDISNINNIILNESTVKNNDNLNEFEKAFIIETNYLADLDKNDKERILKFIEELENTFEKEIPNIFNKSKINNIHYQLQSFIFSLIDKLKKVNKDNGENIIKRLYKRKSDFFQLIRNKDFLDRQKNNMEIKEENEDDFIEVLKNNMSKIMKKYEVDNEIDSMFQKSRKRSKSFNIKSLRMYPKIYLNLYQFNSLNNKKILHKSNSAKKKIFSYGWIMLSYKPQIKKGKLKVISPTKFKKKKKKLNKQTKNSLFAYDFKNIGNVKEDNDEEINNLKDEIQRNKLKKELLERRMNEFFDKIKLLKKGGKRNSERLLELLIDEQLDRMDYSKEKEDESRVNNFKQQFEFNRTKNIFSKKYLSKKIHYLSPLEFFTKPNKDNNSLIN